MTTSLLDLAAQLIDRQAKPFKPAQFSDKYALELRALLAKKAKGQKIEVPAIAAPPQGNVVNIMDALRRSLKATPATAAETKATSAKKRSAR